MPALRALLSVSFALLLGALYTSAASAAGPTPWPAGPIAVDTTWDQSNSPYLVQGSISIDHGVTLTIGPDVVVKLADGSSWDVHGTLEVAGVAGHAVSITSIHDDTVGGDSDGGGRDPAPGDWGSLVVRSDGSATLRYATVRYGGGWDYMTASNDGNLYSQGGALTLLHFTSRDSFSRGVLADGGPLLMLQDGELVKNGGEGLYYAAAGVSIAPVISNTHFVSNTGSAIHLRLSEVALDGRGVRGNSALGNGINGINLGDTFVLTTTLSGDAGMPWVSRAITLRPGARLDVQAGAVVKVQDGQGWDLHGVLDVAGTALLPVSITSIHDDTVGGDSDSPSTPPGPGQWGSLVVRSDGSATLRYTTVRYGGGWDYMTASNDGNLYSQGGALTLLHFTSRDSLSRGVLAYGGPLLVLQDGELLQNYGDGLYYHAAGVSIAPVISNTRFISNTGSAIHLALSEVGFDGRGVRGNSALGNGINGTNLGDTLALTTTLSGDAGMPWVSRAITLRPGARLDVQAGAVVKVQDGQGWDLYGVLDVAGTALLPVSITGIHDDTVGGDSDGSSTPPGPGQWGSLVVRSDGSATLRYTTVRYGGGWDFATAGNDGNVYSQGGALTLLHFTSRDSLSRGVLAYGGPLLVLQDGELLGNSGDGLYYHGGGVSIAPVISNTRFISNTGSAIHLALAEVGFDGRGVRGNSAAGNGMNGINLGDTFVLTTTLSGDAGMPWVSRAITLRPGARLDVQAGAVVKVQDGQGWDLYGVLDVAGTALLPVSITGMHDDTVGGDSDNSSALPGPGQWGSLVVRPDGSATLRYTTVRYGGGWDYMTASNDGNLYSQGGALTLLRFTSRDSLSRGVLAYGGPLLVLQNGELLKNGGEGLYYHAAGVSIAPVISDTRFISNTGSAIHLALAEVGFDGRGVRGNSAAGNGMNGINLGDTFVLTTTLSGDAGMPWVSRAITLRPGARLDVQAGAVVKVQDGQGWDLHGVLDVAGTALLPVSITGMHDDTVGGDSDNSSALPGPGQWGSLVVRPDGSATLRYTTVRYGGGWDNLTGANDGNLYSQGGALTLLRFTSRDSLSRGVLADGGPLLVLQDGELLGNSGDGLYYHGGGVSIAPVISNTRFISNTGWGIFMAGGSSAVWYGNTVRANGAGGIYLQGASPSIYHSLITGNPVGIYCTAGANPLIGGSVANGNDIYGNTSFGVQNTAEPVVNARYNWWGAPSGPHHPTTNPQGGGDEVSDYVDYGFALGASALNPAPYVTVTPDGHDFGAVFARTTSPAATFTVTNTGSLAWATGTVTITGVSRVDFRLLNDMCSQQTVQPFTSCTAQVQFAPLAGRPMTATLVIPSRGGPPLLEAWLRGFGVAADLGVSFVAPPARVQRSQVYTYTALLVNRGPSPATGVTVTGTVSAPGVILGTEPACTFDAHTFSCPQFSLDNQEQVAFRVRVQAAGTGTIDALVRVSAQEPDLAPGDNTVTAQTPVGVQVFLPTVTRH